MTLPLKETLEPALDLLNTIAGWIDQGLNPAEIQRRLASPSGVANDLITKMHARRERGEELLGR